MLDSDIQESVSTIGHHIESSNAAYLSHRRRNQRIDLKDENAVCYLKQGSVSIYRQDNNLLVMSLEAPSVIGLAQITDNSKNHYARCNTDCEIWATGTRDAMALFNNNNLWKQAYSLLNWNLHIYFQRDIMMNHRCSYDMINEHLKLIWSMEPGARETTSIYAYIMARNHISRSGIHKILQSMMDSGLIQVVRGKLIYYRRTDLDV